MKRRSLAKLLIVCSLITAARYSFAAEFVWAPAFPEGSHIPVLEAPDHTGTVQTLASLAGDKGLVLLFSRSVDWCPFCKAQLRALVKEVDAFVAMGFNVSVMTYDSLEILQNVVEDEGVTFKLLHDEALKHVNAYGILNKDYAPGDSAYGIPQPGILVIAPDGTIVKKFAEEDFRKRPDFALVLQSLSAL